MNKINSVLKEALKKVKPSGKEAGEIEILLKKFTERLRKSIKNLGVDAEIFVGGSVAKGTSIKKKVYDADIFLRFNRKYEDISNLTEKILKGFKKTKIHGSRDYFRIKASRKIVLEIVPVLRIKSPKEARNITDLSYFHVNYAKRKFPKKIIDEIILAKAFCHAKNCYGAESYIRGFSGYGLELLVYHYKSFLNFLKAISKPSLNSGNQEKIIIDTEKKFRNKNEILMDVNSSKLQSPVILIDPTHRERNALAALSWETFRKFQKAGRKFLKKPSIRDFEKEKTDIEKIKKTAEKNKNEFILLKAETKKQEGDIAGSKLLKFYNYLTDEIKNNFHLKKYGFQYNEDKSALYFFVAGKGKEILNKGPIIKDKKNFQRFRKKHKKTFIKEGRIYSKKKAEVNLGNFLKKWKGKNAKRMKDMHISYLKNV